MHTAAAVQNANGAQQREEQEGMRTNYSWNCSWLLAPLPPRRGKKLEQHEAAGYLLLLSRLVVGPGAASVGCVRDGLLRGLGAVDHSLLGGGSLDDPVKEWRRRRKR